MNSPLTVVEVAMEIALPPSTLEAIYARHGYRPMRDAAMSTSVGGIGPLLRERLITQAEKGLRMIGVTLLYENTWIQSWFDWGQLHLEKREVASYLRAFLKDTGLQLTLPMYEGRAVSVHVWQLDYGMARLYLLDCPPLTHVVYPSEEDAPLGTPQPALWGEELRHQQSWLIGRGTLALLKALQEKPDIIVMSETPTLFAQHRLAKDAFQNDPFFENTRYVFNDHTPMEYAHPIWPPETLQRLQMGDFSEPVDVTRLVIRSVDGVFGVSEKHGRVMRAMASLRDSADKIESITNGIRVDIWQASEYRQAAALSDAALLSTVDQKKADLLDWVWRQYGLWHTWKEQVRGKAVVLWTRRITGYKRLDLLTAICKDPAMKRQFIESEVVLLVGGRIHQHDDQAQTMVYNLLDWVSQDRTLQERIVLLDNFNIGMAPRLFQGADAAIMLADDNREASATGFMKALVNGDLIIATDDGAIPESVVFTGQGKKDQSPNGFEVPYVNGHPTAEGLLQALKVLHQALQNPAQRVAMIRAAFAAEPRVSIERTAQETVAFYERILTVAPKRLIPTPSSN